MVVPIEEIQAARERLAPYLPVTPLKRAHSYEGQLKANILLKLDLFQPSGSFKVRGALNAMLSLDPATRERGVIASSAGNHGLGLAYASAQLGTPATVVLPESAAPKRAELIRRFGATVIQHGPSWSEANRKALEIAKERDLAFISPFDDPAIIAGQGTIALELLEQVPDLDVIVCSVGGGGLISGVASAIKALRPQTRVIGVETLGSDSVARSLKAGRIVEREEFTSIATSLATRSTAPLPFSIIRDAVERVEIVSDEEAMVDLLQLLDEEKLLTEPAASCTLSVLRSGKVPDLRGATIVPIICGANVILDQVLQWRESLLSSGVKA